MRKKVVALALAIVGMAMAISCSLASGDILSGDDKAIDDTFGQMIEVIEDQGDTSETTNEEEATGEYNEDQGDTSETTNEEEAMSEYIEDQGDTSETTNEEAMGEYNNNWEKELSYKEVEELFAKDRELLEKVKDIFEEYDFNIDIYPNRSRSYSVYYGKSPDRKIFAIEDLDNYEYMLELFNKYKLKAIASFDYTISKGDRFIGFSFGIGASDKYYQTIRYVDGDDSQFLSNKDEINASEDYGFGYLKLCDNWYYNKIFTPE
ncbi:MAG: hypothetical protein FWH48_06630 [Oscillospiraceae bacterium]|nr:hypothetical protein [Oscillospiraceae bacterium]